jgi:hypothetical protein
MSEEIQRQVCEESLVCSPGCFPGSGPSRVADHLVGLRGRPATAARVLDELRAYPDVLTSGRSDGPTALLRLLATLAPEHPQVPHLSGTPPSPSSARALPLYETSRLAVRGRWAGRHGRPSRCPPGANSRGGGRGTVVVMTTSDPLGGAGW